MKLFLARSLKPVVFGLLWLRLCFPSCAATLLLTDATVHTVSGPTLSNAAVLIRDGVIAAVGDKVAGPADQTIDLHGQHLFPGLIAPSTVLGLLEIDAVKATRDVAEVGDYTPDVYAWIAVNPDSEHIPVTRANGYTHAEVMPTGGIVSGHSGVIRLDGWTIEDLAIKRAAALRVDWPAFTLNTTPKDRAPNKDKWKSIEDQIKERDKKLKEIDDFFTEAEAYSKLKSGAKDASSFKSVPAWEAMLPSIKGDLPIIIQAEEFRQIKSAVEWGVRRKYKIAIAGGRDAWRLAPELASNHVDVVYEGVFDQPSRDSDGYDVHYSAPAVLSKAGVRVSFSEGADRFGASSIRNIPYDAAQAMAFGLSREGAWRGLTLYPAILLGVADKLGSIEPGKEASLFVADGDILDLRSHVTRMWIAGREVSLESRHTRLYEKYRNRPKL